MDTFAICFYFVVILVSLFLGLFVSLFIRSLSIKRSEKRRYHHLVKKKTRKQIREEKKLEKEKRLELEKKSAERFEPSTEENEDDIDEESEASSDFEQDNEEENEIISDSDKGAIIKDGEKTEPEKENAPNPISTLKTKFSKEKKNCPLDRVETGYESFAEFSFDGDEKNTAEMIKKMQKTQDSKYIEKIRKKSQS